ncbi:phage tail tape measure protein [Micromonospora sp. WMMD734]|uniref:phage tail tape measure protein n=1 Tax=Micromonospora sp. WMMD734 TaxID=3404129 RepID=UPI003B95AFE9
MALRTVGVRLQAEVSGYMAGMRQAKGATRDLIGEMDKAGKNRHALDSVGDGAVVAGAGLLGLAGAAAKFTMDFEKQMSEVSAVSNATAGDMERLRSAALQAGADTAFSATEAAKAEAELAKAGLSTSAILGGALTGSLSLAAAGTLDLAEAADISAKTMNMFGLKGADVGHIADVLAAAANKSATDVHEMGEALKQGGLAADAADIGLEETVGTLAAFADRALVGSDAGTSLKTMLMMLQAPTDKAAGLMEELGIKAYDTSGNFVGTVKLAGQLQKALGGLTQEQRNAALAQIFGADAMRAANVLYSVGEQGLRDYVAAVDDQGAAADVAAKKMDNLAGDVEKLRGSLETMAIEAGSGANDGLRLLAQGTGAFVDELAELPPAVGSTLTVVAGLSGAALLLGSGWVRVRRSTADMLDELRQVGPNGQRAARGLEVTTKWAGRAAVAFVALEAASAVVSSAQSDLNPQIEALGVGLAKWGQSGALAGESARLLGDDMKDLAVGFKFLADADNDRRGSARWIQDRLESIPVLGEALEGTNTSMARTRERVDAMDQAFAQLVQGGKADEARAAFDRLAASVAADGVSVDEVRKQFPAYAAALETTAAAASKTVSPTSSLTGATKEYKTAADAAASAATGQREALVALSEMMRAEADPVFGLLDAQQKLTEAQKAAAKAVKEHGRNSDEAQEATRKLALAAIGLQEQAGVLSGTFDGKMTPALRQTLKAAGLTESQIKDVAGQFRTAKSAADKYEGTYKANVSLTGYPTTMDRLKRLSTYQQALKKGTIPVGFQGPIQGKDYHAGGWTGPGEKYQPAGVVHADEFVIKKESRGKIERRHPGLLDEMNATGQLPGYDGGGQVWPYRTTTTKTRIPSRAEVAEVVTPGIPTSGATGPAIVAAVKAAFPHLQAISTYRPGATTLSGTRSYHALNRAVDFPPSRELAVWWNRHYMARTKELISPWNDLNIHNGRRHTYTGAVWNQHNWAGGNAHDHIAMANGGLIAEPVFGVGINSGRTYSFAERAPEWVTPWQPGPARAGGGAQQVSVVNHFTINGGTRSPREIAMEVSHIIGRQADLYAR